MSEKVTIKVERKKLHLPTIALRGLVVFPNNLVHFEVGREKSIAAVEWAMANNSNVFLVAQKSMDTTEPHAGRPVQLRRGGRGQAGAARLRGPCKGPGGGQVPRKAQCTGCQRRFSALRRCARPRCAQARPTMPWRPKRCCAPSRPGLTSTLGMNPRLGKDVVFAIVSSDDPAFLSEYMPCKPAVPLRGQAGCDGRGHPRTDG